MPQWDVAESCISRVGGYYCVSYVGVAKVALLIPPEIGRGNMEISTLLIRIVFLALPGLLASKLYWKLRGHPKRENWEKFFDVMLFSLLSYLLYCSAVALVQVFGLVSPPKDSETTYLCNLLDTFLDEKKPLQWWAILASSTIGAILALLASYVHRYSLGMRAARCIRATSRIGDEDIWETFFSQPKVEWVIVHDAKRNLMFYGYARYFSDSESPRELVLENVQVYTNDTGEPLYETGLLYLSASSEDWLVEVQKPTDSTKGDEKCQTKNKNS